MVYLKPRQDWNILAPPPPFPTLFFALVFPKTASIRGHNTPEMCLYGCVKSLLPFLSFILSPSLFFPLIPSSFMLILLLSCAIFHPPALSFSHHHSCCYFMSCLRPGKYRPQTWAISLVSVILPHFTCFTIYSNLAGKLWMCVFVSFFICLLLISQHAGHKCVKSAGTCRPLLSVWQAKLQSLQMQYVARKDVAGTTRSLCVSGCPIIPIHVFMQVFVCVDGVFRDTDM